MSFDSPSHAPRRGSLGRGPWLPLAVVASLAALGLLAWWTASRAEGPEIGQLRGRNTEWTAVDPADPTGSSRTPSGATASIEVRTPQAIERPLESFDGRGRLRGKIELGRGAEPAELRVHLTPSETIRAEATGERRELTLAAGETDFAFEDLPLAAYELRVEAKGLSSAVRRVLLQKPVVDQYVVVQVLRAGFIDGFARDNDGQPVDELDLFLEHVGSGARRTARTDASGAYAFHGVQDGTYRLSVGNPERAIATKEIAFEAPSSRVDFDLPPLGAMDCRVLDAFGNPLPNVDVRAYGTRGTSIDAPTDAEGKLRARFLVPGTYRLQCTEPAHGTARATVEVEAGAVAKATLRFKQP